MDSARRRRAIVRILLVSLLLSGSFAGCSGGGGGGDGEPSAFELLSFDQADRSDVARNQVLAFRFSASIDPRTVDVNGFQVRSGPDVFEGRVVVRDRTILFIPTIFEGDRNDYTPSNNPPLNGLGFRPLTRYQVLALGGSPFSIHSLSGRALGTTFQSEFSTGRGFLPETPNIAPHVVGVPQISPDPEVPGGDVFGDPNDPGTLPLYDPSNLSIRLQFSEPMDPSGFDPFSTLTLVNVTPGAGSDPEQCGVAGLGEPIPGHVALSGDALSVTFEPLFTLGDLPCSAEPFVFRVSLSPGVTDLAGNALGGPDDAPLRVPYAFHFATIDRPGEPTFSAKHEDFTSIEHRGSLTDPEHPNTAHWDGNGSLEGLEVVRRTITVAPPETAGCPPTCNLPQPLWPQGNRLQMLYLHDDFGNLGLESIVSMAWGPRSNYVFASTYPTIQLKLGHSRVGSSPGLSNQFDLNYEGFESNPTVVYEGSYRVENRLNASWQDWPEFFTDFEYRGQGSIVWEANVAPSGTTFQGIRYTWTAPAPSRRIFDAYNASIATCPAAVPGGFAGCGENTIYHQQFVVARKKSFGVSQFYDTREDRPDYARPLVRFDEPRGGPCVTNQRGGCFVVMWEGADATLTGEIDLDTRTGFAENIDTVDGHRFIRFEILFNGNPFSGVVPVVDSVTIPYRSGGGT